ncbi:hypothetical protein BDU57DRAFT_546428 [Ampelomyces quisqualis]|uniref:NAD(P)-binding protein n=1 Tax=Ampelomyces quisqualis TaxID=50730 RepID=A0A6A5QZ47_AMPQU|nr:hypothetical protein BDU57DRAFT_546428 [Ampelomyces quisqualis]
MAGYRPSAPKVQQQDLQGKVALITGATKGIGRATALDLATRGCSIIGTYSSPQSAHNFDVLSHTISTLYSSSPCSAPILLGIVSDITTLSSISPIQRAIESMSATNTLDILILNAAIHTAPKLGSASASDMTDSLTGNLHWPMVLLETLVRENSLANDARVVAITSDIIRSPAQGSSLFAATRAGLEALVRAWAVELPPLFPGTTVNAVSVGMVDTPGLSGLPVQDSAKVRDERVKRVKVVEGGRVGFAEEVADVVGWLVSEKARWVTGSVVPANGGAERV